MKCCAFVFSSSLLPQERKNVSVLLKTNSMQTQFALHSRCLSTQVSDVQFINLRLDACPCVVGPEHTLWHSFLHVHPKVTFELGILSERSTKHSALNLGKWRGKWQFRRALWVEWVSLLLPVGKKGAKDKELRFAGGKLSVGTRS